jgi:hypothetical protein
MPLTQFFFLAWDKLHSQLEKENNLKQQGVAVCGESRSSGFEAEGRRVTSCSTVTVVDKSRK